MNHPDLNAASGVVPLPRHMWNLPIQRGYPVPWIVMQINGQYEFAVNNHLRVMRCVKECRCAICGNRLDPVMWWVGGPVAALDPHGAYADTALHHECMVYALKVCPYLAMRNWQAGRSTDNAIERLRDGPADLIDHTMIPGRPEVFMAVAARSFTVSSGSNWTDPPTQHPARPYLLIEYWRLGMKLDDVQGHELAESEFRKRAPWNQARAEAAVTKEA